MGMEVTMSDDWQLIAELARETDKVDPVDFENLAISEDEAFNLMAMHVAEMEDDPLTLKVVCVKMLVENFVLNLKLMRNR
jgi:hypothetical protein